MELVGRATVLSDPAELMPIGEGVFERYTGEKRLGVRIDVDKVVSWDHRKLQGAY